MGGKKDGGIRSRYIAIPLFVPGVSAYDAVQFIFCCKLTLVHFLRILIVCKSQWEAWSIGCILETFAVLQVVDTLLSEHLHVHKKLTLACCTTDWKKWEEKKTWVAITFSTAALCIASVCPSPSIWVAVYVMKTKKRISISCWFEKKMWWGTFACVSCYLSLFWDGICFFWKLPRIHFGRCCTRKRLYLSLILLLCSIGFGHHRWQASPSCASKLFPWHYIWPLRLSLCSLGFGHFFRKIVHRQGLQQIFQKLGLKLFCLLLRFRIHLIGHCDRVLRPFKFLFDNIIEDFLLIGHERHIEELRWFKDQRLPIGRCSH